jgi:gliding motility-associated-like protein
MKVLSFLLLILIATNCSASVTADFNASTYSGCSPLIVNFTNNSTPGVTTQWNFGNGNTSILSNPSATFNTSGNYSVVLIVSNGTHTDTISKNIRVFQSPIVAFEAVTPNSCVNLPIQFNNQVIPGDAPISDYAWGFGNGISSSVPNAVYGYPLPGIYDITLVVQDTNGCSANTTLVNYVSVNSNPVSNFTVQPAVSCGTSQLVSFTNTSTGQGLSYNWIFPDDTLIAAAANQSHIYYSALTRQRAILVATDPNGCTDTTSKNVSVWDLHGDFFASKTDACVGEPIAFTNASNLPGNLWEWDFGDGTGASTKNAVKTYTSAGTYTVTYKIKQDICGDTIVKVDYIHIRQSIIPTFGADTTITCQTPITVNFNNTTPGGVQFQWDFGDGTTSTDENPQHTYTGNSNYTVTLTVIDTSGCPASSAISSMIQTAKPKTKFSCDTIGCLGTPIKFVNTTYGGGDVFWNFGDGTTSTSSPVFHTFPAYGDYTVSLTVTNSNGCDSTTTKTIHIEELEANFSVNNTFSPCPPFVAIFQSTVSMSNIKYLWNFGDGYSDTTANPTHIYFHPGLYTVQLIVTKVGGCTDTVTYINLIEVQGPAGEVIVTPNIGCSPLTVSFSGSASLNTFTLAWDLGDGTVINDSLNISHVYTASQVYHPRLILTDHIGCTVPYDADSIIVLGTPTLNLNDTSICEGASVVLNLGIDKYQWYPSTYLNCDTCGNVTITPAVSTTYHIVANPGTQCSSSGDYTVNVVPLPVSSLHQTIDVCEGSTVSLSVNNADAITWAPAAFLSNPNGATTLCSPDSSITYIIESKNELGCSVSSTYEVNVIEGFTLEPMKDTSFCGAGKVQLGVNPLARLGRTFTYQWNNDGLLDNPNVSNPTASVSHPTTFTVTVTSNTCVSSQTASVTVDVTPPPTVNVTSDQKTVTPQQEVKFSAQADQPVTYLWEANDNLSCIDCQQTVMVAEQNQFVKVTVTSATGCKAQDSVLLQVKGCPEDAVFVPNAFTPNADGNNDEFKVFSNVLSDLNYMRVFDRWGQIVYETTDINAGWDGNYRGEKSQPGVYVYVMQAQCGSGFTMDKKGSFTLLR